MGVEIGRGVRVPKPLSLFGEALDTGRRESITHLKQRRPHKSGRDAQASSGPARLHASNRGAPLHDSLHLTVMPRRCVANKVLGQYAQHTRQQ